MFDGNEDQNDIRNMLHAILGDGGLPSDGFNPFGQMGGGANPENMGDALRNYLSIGDAISSITEAIVETLNIYESHPLHILQVIGHSPGAAILVLEQSGWRLTSHYLRESAIAARAIDPQKWDEVDELERSLIHHANAVQVIMCHHVQSTIIRSESDDTSDWRWPDGFEDDNDDHELIIHQIEHEDGVVSVEDFVTGAKFVTSRDNARDYCEHFFQREKPHIGEAAMRFSSYTPANSEDHVHTILWHSKRMSDGHSILPIDSKELSHMIKHDMIGNLKETRDDE